MTPEEIVDKYNHPTLDMLYDFIFDGFSMMEIAHWILKLHTEEQIAHLVLQLIEARNLRK